MKRKNTLSQLLLLCTTTTPFLQNCGISAQEKDRNDPSRNSIQSLSLQHPDIVSGATPKIRNYKELFGVHDPHSKVVDNHGDGFETLYGVRNFRVVLHGIFYRGGANNLYNKFGKRANQNPLPTIGLKNLCELGFSNAVYFYPTNFSSAPQNLSCQNSEETNTLNYEQITALSGDNYIPMLNLIFDRIQSPNKGPIYGHCWNGWHASGFISAIALRQFCNYSAEAADNYWVSNIEGSSNGYNDIRSKIRAFQPFEKWKISSAIQAQICP